MYSPQIRFLLVSLSWLSCLCCSKKTDPISNIPIPEHKVKGMALVAPPSPFEEDPIKPMTTLGVNWVSIQPYGFFKKNHPEISYNKGQQWWGEVPEGIAKSVEHAHENNVKVLLKPQLWTHSQWIGDFDLEHEQDLQTWQNNYETFILGFAKMADSLKVEMLCIATEIKQIAQKHPDYWRALIKKIRLVYKGSLTYAANWDSWQNISFWDDLDYIGVDAYFPLVKAKTATVSKLQKAWKPIVEELAAFHKQYDKPILFTEFGYMSVDDCAYNHWNVEAEQASRAINEQAQANALQALFETFANLDWWHGGFQWKWYPNNQSNWGEGAWAKDYTPQDKEAEKVLKKYF